MGHVKMSSVLWVVQSNLGSQLYLEKMENAFSSLGIAHQQVKAIPFSDEIPNVREWAGPVVFYGAVSFTQRVWNSGKWPGGVFFDEDHFTYRSYLENYGENMLNSDAKIVRLGDVSKEHLGEDLVFLRPLNDLKTFAGTVISAGEAFQWIENLNYGNYMDPDLEILVSTPKYIKAEWRLFIVKGKVSSGSLYQHSGRLKKSSKVPGRVKLFAMDLASKWSPHDVFVMDVCETSQGKLKVVECGSFNSTGFYDADVEKIIRDITGYVKEA